MWINIHPSSDARHLHCASITSLQEMLHISYIIDQVTHKIKLQQHFLLQESTLNLELWRPQWRPQTDTLVAKFASSD